MKRRALPRWIEGGLLVVGCALIAITAATYLEAGLVQWALGRQLEHARANRSGGGAELPSPDPGDLIGRLEIPRLDLATVVLEGIDARTLRRAVGHVRGTALPGSGGNVVLAGHRDRAFRRLRDAHPGDLVTITTMAGVFRYRIDSLSVVPPSRTEVLASSDASRLTLVTCYPFHYVGPAPRRFVVQAREVEREAEGAVRRSFIESSLHPAARERS